MSNGAGDVNQIRGYVQYGDAYAYNGSDKAVTVYITADSKIVKVGSVDKYATDSTKLTIIEYNHDKTASSITSSVVGISNFNDKTVAFTTALVKYADPAETIISDITVIREGVPASETIHAIYTGEGTVGAQTGTYEFLVNGKPATYTMKNASAPGATDMDKVVGVKMVGPEAEKVPATPVNGVLDAVVPGQYVAIGTTVYTLADNCWAYDSTKHGPEALIEISELNLKGETVGLYTNAAGEVDLIYLS